MIRACLIILHFQGQPIGTYQFDNLPKVECSRVAALYRSRGYAPWTEVGRIPLRRGVVK